MGDFDKTETATETGKRSEQTVKKLTLKWVLCVAAACVLVGGIAAAVTSYVSKSNGEYSAFKNLHSEVASRLSDTAFSGVRALPQTLAEGTINIEFSITDDWDYSGNVEVKTSAADKSFQLTGILDLYGFTADITTLLNNERFAFASSLIDGGYYGFAFETFDSDLRTFANLVGMPDEISQEIRKYVHTVEDILNKENTVSDETRELYADIGGIFKQFVLEMDFAVKDETVSAGGKDIDAVVYTCEIQSSEIFALLRNLRNTIPEGDSIREIFETAYGNGESYTVFEDSITDFDEWLNDAEADNEGSMVLSAAVSDKRVVSISAVSDLSFQDESTKFNMNVDFGGSITDTWKFTFAFEDYWGDEYVCTISWKYSEGHNTIVYTFEGDYMPAETMTLDSVWNSESGAFSLFMGDEYNEYALSGVIEYTDDAFTIIIDPIDRADITIRAEKGADIPNPDYLNLDKWDMSLLEKIAIAVDELLY